MRDAPEMPSAASGSPLQAAGADREWQLTDGQSRSTSGGRLIAASRDDDDESSARRPTSFADRALQRGTRRPFGGPRAGNPYRQLQCRMRATVDS